MKFFLAIIIGTFLLQAQTGEDIVRKYNLKNPQYTEKELDISNCTELKESTDYYYYEDTKKQDSTITWINVSKHGLIYRKSVFTYDTLDNGFSKKLTLVTERISDTSAIDTFDVIVAKFNKQGLMTEEISISKSVGEIIRKFTYNIQRRKTSGITLVNGVKWYDEKFSYNKNGHRANTTSKSGISEGTIYRHTNFDSLLATIEIVKGNEIPYILNFYKNKLKVKQITYNWNTNTFPSNCTYFYYNKKKQLTKFITLTDIDIYTEYKDKNSFTPARYHVYKYDNSGRVVQMVARNRPYPD